MPRPSRARSIACHTRIGVIGMDTSLTLVQARQSGENGFLRELVDPAPGLLREFGEGAQT